ncbi:BgTH12-01743 [Blumeria graminis f. sp. triticale]|uniref:Bgt-1879 n=3 Tax=Blumeria graminis TaxID=34373 RepID=A0A061HGF9_BLUGR|nr:Subunit of the COMPASS complex [Blumeria graminis f. sp. tritici 96224]CAD6501491.1 BgTH12-01743 [Blumeria graminis f. sp. triticale]VDB84026.1 Bgt-1879 [Blumeria graminis f. sp. tritici]
MNLALVDPFVLAQDYPESLIGSLRSGHTCCVRFSRKGDFLAAGRVDGTVVIFDVETNGVARKLKGHVRQVQSLSWSQNGRYLLTSSQDWKCNIWDLQTMDIIRSVRFEAPVYIADFHPQSHLTFVVALFEDQPMLVDATDSEVIKMALPSIPKQTKYNANTNLGHRRAAQNAKQTTTVATFTCSGEHILTGTNKGWLNIIDTITRTIIYSTKICAGVVIFMRLTGSGRDLVVNCQDRIIRTIQLPSLSGPDLDPDTIDIEIEHKFQDVVNKLSWNHVAFSATGEYVTASAYNNHDIYIWERNHGSLVKILEGPKEEHGVVEWHPNKPLIVACGLETGRIHTWSIVPQQRWSALAPDFVEVEENVEYTEREDEFDIHPQEEIHKRRLDLEDEDVDVLTMGPMKGVARDESAWRMPVQLDLIDSEAEEEFIAVGRGEMRRKDATDSRDYGLESEVGDLEEVRKKPRNKKR